MGDSNSVAHNAAWLIAQPILVGVVSIVVTALVARDLGTTNYGTLLLLISYSAVFTQLSNLGLRPYTVREIAADRRRALEMVSDMIVLRAMLALLAILVAVPFVTVIDTTLPAALIGALFLLIFFNSLTGCFIDGLQGAEHMKAVATSFATSGILTQLACMASLALDWGLNGIAAAYTLGALVMLVMVGIQFSRLTGSLKPASPGGRQLAHLRLSWAYLLQNVVGVVRNRIDLLLINSMLGAHAAGIYGSSMVLVQRLDLIQDGIATALFSRVAYLYTRSRDELIALVRGAIKFVLVIATPCAVGLFAVSNEIVALMFGRQFAESGPILAIVGLAVPFLFVGGVLFNVLRAMDLAPIVLRATIWATVMTLVFFVVGIITMVTAGAAIAFVSGSALLAALLLREYWLRYGAPWTAADLGKIVAANAVMGFSLWLMQDQHLAVKILAAMVIFAGVTRMLGLVTPAMIKAMFARKSA
ncbi:MAG: flippase [Phycisphaerae bacterium]|nr:flippase [Gemmatimonadaceae bacterium]